MSFQLGFQLWLQRTKDTGFPVPWAARLSQPVPDCPFSLCPSEGLGVWLIHFMILLWQHLEAERKLSQEMPVCLGPWSWERREALTPFVEDWVILCITSRSERQDQGGAQKMWGLKVPPVILSSSGAVRFLLSLWLLTRKKKTDWLSCDQATEILVPLGMRTIPDPMRLCHEKTRATGELLSHKSLELSNIYNNCSEVSPLFAGPCLSLS